MHEEEGVIPYSGKLSSSTKNPVPTRLVSVAAFVPALVASGSPFAYFAHPLLSLYLGLLYIIISNQHSCPVTMV
jgi:hypothetical protein